MLVFSRKKWRKKLGFGNKCTNIYKAGLGNIVSKHLGKHLFPNTWFLWGKNMGKTTIKMFGNTCSPKWWLNSGLPWYKIWKNAFNKSKYIHVCWSWRASPTRKEMRRLVRMHPGRSTWNLRMHPWKRKIIFPTIIFRFYANLLGCKMWPSPKKMPQNAEPPNKICGNDQHLGRKSFFSVSGRHPNFDKCKYQPHMNVKTRMYAS